MPPLSCAMALRMAGIGVRLRATGRLLASVPGRFVADDGLGHASALAYTTLLAVVPVVALMLAAVKGIGAADEIEGLLLARFALDPEVVAVVREGIERVNVATVGTLGAGLLIFTVVSVLGHIESTFNHVWRVRTGRPWWRRLTDYLGVLTLTPLLLLLATGLTSFVTEHQVLDRLLAERLIGDVTALVLQALPYAFNVAALAILYLVMPHRRPHLPSLLVAAVVAGVLWQLLQVGYVRLQVGVARYNAIYGALAQLPVTLVWLYVSWVVVIGGAELAAVLEYGADDRPARPVSDLGLGLEMLTRALASFNGLSSPPTALALARECGVDLPRVMTMAERLAAAGWLVWVADEPGAFVLARAPASIGALDAVALLEDEAGANGPARHALAALGRARARGLEGYTLADLLEGVSASAGAPDSRV